MFIIEHCDIKKRYVMTYMYCIAEYNMMTQEVTVTSHKGRATE